MHAVTHVFPQGGIGGFTWQVRVFQGLAPGGKAAAHQARGCRLHAGALGVGLPGLACAAGRCPGRSSRLPGQQAGNTESGPSRMPAMGLGLGAGRISISGSWGLEGGCEPWERVAEAESRCALQGGAHLQGFSPLASCKQLGSHLGMAGIEAREPQGVGQTRKGPAKLWTVWAAF